MSTFKPISISLSPNTEKDDIRLALKLILKPGQWKKGKETEKIEEELKDYISVNHVVSFNSGRSALFAALKSLDLKENDEILLQSFTCNALINPILWANLKPIYVDCQEDTFNINAEDLKRKITPKSKAVIIQHTFGLPAEIDKILEICQKNNLILIEDCAHSLGANYKGKKVGTFGKVSFFSFSRDKVISSVYGGAVATTDEILAKKIKEFQEKIGYPSNLWTLQQLLHPALINYLILPTYSFLGIGKILLNILQWLKILSKAVHWKEKRGKMPNYFPKRLPNGLAILALSQFRKLERFNKHRQEIADFYFQALARKQGSEERSGEGSYYKELKNTKFILPSREEQIFLRFAVRHPNAHQIIKAAWQNNILIGDWYTTPIAPHDTKLNKMQYQLGGCPVAEKLSKETLNLPTHINISEKEAQKIVGFIKSYGN